MNRLLARSHQRRDQFRIDNLARCQPPSNWFDERAPYYWSASQHCKAVHLDQTLAEPHKVVVSLGGTPLKHLLGIHKGIRVQDFHGCVTPLPDGKWLVPTFHPSHLQRGAMNLFGAVSFDLQRALQVAEHGWHPTPVDVVVDPPVDWFTWWVEQVAAAVAQEPGSQRVWIAEDIETPDKASGRDEGELTSEDRSFQILRINFSVHPDEGVTVPYAGPYIALCQRLFALNTIHSLWNMEYDNPRLLAAGHTFSGERLDWMWAWHHLQSDVPRGLGFVAPFYSDFGAWKHLSEAQPGYYAGVDGFQTTRVSFGIAQDLEALGLWEVYWRHTHQVHKLALQPAQKVGVKIDRQRLDVFIESLEVKQRRLLHEMQGLVPDAWKPLTPKSGLKKAPADGVLHSKGTELKRDGQAKKEAPDPIKQELYAQTATVVARVVSTFAACCDACGAREVAKTHRCAGTTGDNPARIAPKQIEVTRYFWQEPFNPDSPDQILDFIRHRGHKPGRAKKTGADSTDRETLSRLARETKDPLYQKILDTRAVGKVRGTYGVGTRKLLDAESRVHPVPTFKPSTHRLSYVSPNITNVVADKGGAETLAAGFRACVVASEQDPDWAPQQAPSVHRGTRLFECVAPESRILKSDLTWVRADAVQVGDELVAFDEMPKGHAHSFRAGTVESVTFLRRPRVRVHTTHGSTVVAANHPLLARMHKAARRWVYAADLKAGMRIAFLAEPWEFDESREAGYLAGFFDGEGWIGRVNVGYGQNSGPTLERVQGILAARGYEFCVTNTNRNIHIEITNGIRATLRFLGTIRPPRLMPKARQIWEGRRTWGKQSPVCRVLSIEPLEEGPVVAIKTSTRTYISDGFFSHNCDFSGIEAVLTGWFQRDPAYMRLARLGVHAGLTSHVVGKPFNPSLPDAEIAAYFSALKAAEPIIYDRCKRNVHGKNYGLTIHGMVKNFPQTFPTLSAAKKISDIYDQMAPGLPVLHTDLRTVAYELNYLGGPSKPLHYPHHLGQIFARNPHLERHPFGYKHWFWSVLGFRGIPYSAYIKRQQQHEPVCIIQGKYFAITLGEDAKRVIAFFPQSTAAAVLKEVMLRLMDPEHPSYVGDAYYGQTPFRAPIHDSLFWEIPVRVWDRVVERIYREMLRPVPELPLDWVSVEDRARYGMGPLLSIGVEGKAGPNWKDMSKVKSPTLQELGLSGDDVVFPVEEADAEDLESLGTVA